MQPIGLEAQRESRVLVGAAAAAMLTGAFVQLLLDAIDRVYSLRTDPHLAEMRRPSFQPRGLVPTHGLIGTATWWATIESGALALHLKRGVIRGLWLG